VGLIGTMSKPILYDVFCGAGGTTKGYQLAGFEVIGVDVNPQPHYCGEEFVQMDAFEFFDAVDKGLFPAPAAWHCSPPCQGYIQRNKNLTTKHPKLIEPVRQFLAESGVPWVIENVEGAPLHSPIILCGTMFKLPLRRHRMFEFPPEPELTWAVNRLTAPEPCNHWGTVANGDFAGVYAFGGKGKRHGKDVRDPKNEPGPDWGKAMGIDWMTKKELTQAIPPAYCEYIGQALLVHMGERC